MSNGDLEKEKIVEKEGEKKEEKQVVNKVELTSEQYNAMLDDLAELEALRAAKPKKKEEEEEEFDVDKLAKEGKRTKVKEDEGEEIDLDNLTNTQLARLIVTEINKQSDERINALETEVVTLKMLREIDKAEGQHEDFWDYGDQIKKMCVGDPNLSVEDAYILAKSKSPIKKETSEKEPVQTKTERLLKLPPRVHGEKPTSVAAGSTTESEKGKTIRSAAEKAWDETMKGKTQI